MRPRLDVTRLVAKLSRNLLIWTQSCHFTLILNGYFVIKVNLVRLREIRFERLLVGNGYLLQLRLLSKELLMLHSGPYLNRYATHVGGHLGNPGRTSTITTFVPLRCLVLPSARRHKTDVNFLVLGLLLINSRTHRVGVTIHSFKLFHLNRLLLSLRRILLFGWRLECVLSRYWNAWVPTFPYLLHNILLISSSGGTLLPLLFNRWSIYSFLGTNVLAIDIVAMDWAWLNASIN